MELFRRDEDYAAFVRTLAETIECVPMRVCGYCLMPNHWHLALWPEHDGALSRFMQRLRSRTFGGGLSIGIALAWAAFIRGDTSRLRLKTISISPR